MNDAEPTYIGVLGSDSGGKSACAIRGIRRFAEANGLTVADFGPLGGLAQQAEAVANWPVSGVLAFKNGLQVGCPVVEVFSPEHVGRPRVDVDHQALARAAYLHLRALNPQSLSLLRTPNCPEEFTAGWVAAGGDQKLRGGDFLITSESPSLTDISQGERNRFNEWLAHLPRPAGIVCTSDAIAAACLSSLRSAGVAIPDEVALISCADLGIAEQLTPAVSSVSGSFENAGYEAAHLLSRIIRGDNVRPELTVVAGATVHARSSSDRLAALPEDIRKAQDFIRQNSCSGINVKDVMQTQKVSRVTFERRFKEHTGQTPGAEIRRIRIEKAEELLATTDLSVTQIAAQCGFEGSSRFSLFFRKRMGLSPSEYRKRRQ